MENKLNPEIIKAENQARCHIQIPEGQLCEECNISLATDRHHPDYMKPLEVKFLCRSCHRKINKSTRHELTNQGRSEMSSKAIIPIRDSNKVIIKIRMNYSEVAEILNKHGNIFLRGLNRKEASYAHKRLEMLCKCKLEAHPAFLQESNEEGYYFERVE